MRFKLLCCPFLQVSFKHQQLQFYEVLRRRKTNSTLLLEQLLVKKVFFLFLFYFFYRKRKKIGDKKWLHLCTEGNECQNVFEDQHLISADLHICSFWNSYGRILFCTYKYVILLLSLQLQHCKRINQLLKCSLQEIDRFSFSIVQQMWYCITNAFSVSMYVKTQKCTKIQLNLNVLIKISRHTLQTLG